MNEQIINKRSKQKEKLTKEAEKAIVKLKKELLKHRVDYIASLIGVSPPSLSRFMGMEDRYVTRSMIDRVNMYLNDMRHEG